MLNVAAEPLPAVPTKPECLKLKLEFGENWSKTKIVKLIERARRITDANRRMSFIVRHFLAENTSFLKESYLPALPSNTLRIRFASFDCVTFLYYMNALNSAGSFNEFVANLRHIRYEDGVVAPENLIHYPWNVAAKMIARGLSLNVTAEIMPLEKLATRRVQLDVTAGGKRFLGDKLGRLGDVNAGRIVTARYIPMNHVAEAEAEMKSGDTLLFVSAKRPSEYPGIVWHGAIVYKRRHQQAAFLIHASATRINHRRPRIAGVSICRHYDFDEEVMWDNRDYRPVHRYLKENKEVQGVIILRPQNRSAVITPHV